MSAVAISRSLIAGSRVLAAAALSSLCLGCGASPKAERVRIVRLGEPEILSLLKRLDRARPVPIADRTRGTLRAIMADPALRAPLCRDRTGDPPLERDYFVLPGRFVEPRSWNERNRPEDLPRPHEGARRYFSLEVDQTEKRLGDRTVVGLNCVMRFRRSGSEERRWACMTGATDRDDCLPVLMRTTTTQSYWISISGDGDWKAIDAGCYGRGCGY